MSTDTDEVAVAKRIRPQSGAEAQRLLRVQRSLLATPPPGLVRLLSVQRDGDVVVVVRDYDDGVPLSRLVSVTSLAASQAAALAAAMLGSLRGLHDSGLAHGSLTPGNVLLHPDGSVRLTDACTAVQPAAPPPTARAADLEAVSRLVLAMWRQPRRRSWPQLETVLEYEIPAAGDAGHALRLLGERDAELVQQGRPGLAALAARLHPVAPPAEMDLGPEPPVLNTAQREHAAQAALDTAVRRLRRRRLERWALAVALVAVVAGGGIAGWRMASSASSKPAAHQVRQTVTTPRPTPAPSPQAPVTTPSAATQVIGLEPPAPLAVGGVSDVELSFPSSACAAGSSCTVASRVDLAAPAAATTITWSVVAVDACSGVQVILGSASVVAEPQYQYVYDTMSLTVPGPDSQLLFGVTSQPVRVASTAARVDGAPCPAAV